MSGLQYIELPSSVVVAVQGIGYGCVSTHMHNFGEWSHIIFVQQVLVVILHSIVRGIYAFSFSGLPTDAWA